MHKSTIFLFFMLSPFLGLCQRFGGTPPSVKWKQLNTDSARIIYAKGMDSAAQRIASIIHYEAAHSGNPLGKQIRKINIVLQNQTVVPNGYVGLGPYRSEFYLTPALNAFEQGSVPWADQLAVHEYRHVQQFNNFRNGLSKLMKTLFGEEGYALAVDAAIPDWFFEGDAVFNETILTRQGRGRLPLFLNSYPTLWNAGKNYSWMKLRNGSFKDYVPNHYDLGYLLVNYGYEKYGAQFWSNVTKDASSYKGLFYPFQKAIQRYSGWSYREFRKQALNYYREKFEQVAMVKDSSNPVVNLNKQVVNDYFFPYTISQDSLLYLKSSYNRRTAFFIRDSKGEHRVRTRDISLEDQYGYRNGKIVYAAYENDPRWQWRDYSVIRLLDINTGVQRTITHRSKYFSPDISADGTLIAAVQLASDGKSQLHILDTKSGAVLHQISAADIATFSDPKFVSNNSVIVAIRLQDGKMALAMVDLNKSSVVRLTTPSYHVVGNPSIDGDKVYFTASYDGADDIYVMDLSGKGLAKVGHQPLGSYFVNAKEGQLHWSTRTAEGYQLQQTSISNLDMKRAAITRDQKEIEEFPVALDSSIQPVLPDIVPFRNFASKNYSKGTRLLNFHSWRPYYEDPEFTFSVYGENVLNTLQTEIYYLYNQDDNTSAVGASAVYGQLFPYLSVGTQYTFDRTSNFNNRYREWNQLDSRVGFNIPLNWTSGRTYKSFNVGTNYFYRNEFHNSLKDSIGNTSFSYLHYFISFGQQVATARQHIFPKLGYNVSAEYRNKIEGAKSWQALTRGSLYLPGILPTHSLVLTGAFQQTDTVAVVFGNRLPYPRGYNEAYLSKMWSVSANYHFPIVYPDWGFANILYISRVRGNAFYDFGRVYSNDKTAHADQRSVGGEIYLDTRWWNQYPLTFGFRVSHLLDRDLYTRVSGAKVFELVLPVSIFPK